MKRWSGDSWAHGGASVWVTGSYDPDLNLTYWGIGNPGPDFNNRKRPGDNLYSDSMRRARPRYRRAEVAFPVHAERSARLRLGADSGARRYAVERNAAQAAAVGAIATVSSTFWTEARANFFWAGPLQR